MPNYEAWNDAIIEFFTFGAPVGSTIYLEVSERNLELIGRQTWGWKPATAWTEDFLGAVRGRLEVGNASFLRQWRRRERRVRPPGVAFLGVLVLVATRMDRIVDQKISEKNYFVHLNRALETEPTNDQVQRPRFMQHGYDCEEPLWRDWEAFLRERGYLPTAAGGGGAWRYIGYAVSQTLLRMPEKRQLFKLFTEKQWPPDIDPDDLVNEIRRINVLPAHVQALLRRTGQAAEDVHHALNEAFSEWLERGDADSDAPTRLGSMATTITAGLYRTEHWRSGDPEYALYPKQPRGRRWGQLSVAFPDGSQQLVVERPGFFAPLGCVDADRLEQGAQFPLTGHPELTALTLPRRRFWVLRIDPDVPRAYASLGRPPIGEHLLILARDELAADLKRLRELGLLQWSAEEPWAPGWHEYHGAMVVASHWQDATDVAQDLRDALAPASGVSLSVTGGMVVPRAGAWLADGPPTVRVNSFFNDVVLTLTKDGDELWSGPVEPNAEVALPWSGPGSYEVDVEGRGQGQRRLVNLVDWVDLPPPSTERLGQVTVHIGNLQIAGPHHIDLTEAEL